MSDNNSQNLVILDVEDNSIRKEKRSTFSTIKSTLLREHSMTLRQKVVFFRILATMVNANLTILASLRALLKQEKAKNLIIFYEFMIEKLRSGTPMNRAMGEYYGVFTDAEVSIVEAGERTGKLNQALNQIADQTEKVDSITRKLKGAMTYPILLIVGMIAVIAILMVKVIPTLTEFFSDDPTKLPQATQTIIAISNFFGTYWIHMIIGVIAAIVGISIWKKTRTGKYRWDSIMLLLPIFGTLMQKVILSRFARIFANLINSGVAVVEAIRIVSGAVGNEVYKQRIILLKEDVKAGQKIAEAIEDDPLFPDLLVAMVRVGEETAQIGDTIIKVADFYDEEVDIAISSIQKLIEPIILVVMGGTVGFLAIGIFQPIMNMAGTIGN